MLKGQRVLVVEDDSQVAEILYWNLWVAGYAVTVIQDGLDALQEFDERCPALVTMDLNVPTISGFRLVELFKRHAAHVPVIVITASAFEEAEDAARAGADDFVSKPFDPQQVLRKIEYLINRTNLSQAKEAPHTLSSRP